MSLFLSHVCDDELVDAPVLVAAVGEVAPDDEGDLSLLELLHGDLERVRLALELHHHRGAHRDLEEKTVEVPHQDKIN